MKKVVYTACFGLDIIHEPTFISPGWDYVFFTDKKNTSSKDWDVVYLDPDTDSRKFSRKVKILNERYLPGYDLSVYIDARFVPRIDFNDFVDSNLNYKDIAMMKHHKRNCVYEEAEVCTAIKKDSKHVIAEQMERYKKENYPVNNGLTAGGVIVRKHGIKNQRKFMEEWYSEIEKGSWRDQLSFQYVFWKRPLNISLMDFKKVYGMLK